MNDDSTINPLNPSTAPQIAAALASVADTAKPTGIPWGPWATLGWTAVVLILTMVVQTVVSIVYVASLFALDRHTDLKSIAADGNLIGLTILASAAIAVGMVVLLCYARGVPVSEYLALKRPRGRETAVWLFALFILAAASDLITYSLGRPVVPQFSRDMFRTTSMPLLLLVLNVVAPLWEEILMRGFVFTGIQSRWGTGWAIVLSAVIWAILHMQYGWFEIAGVIVMGLYLGFARHVTGSTLLTMLLHFAANAIATVEAIIVVA